MLWRQEVNYKVSEWLNDVTTWQPVIGYEKTSQDKTGLHMANNVCQNTRIIIKSQKLYNNVTSSSIHSYSWYVYEYSWLIHVQGMLIFIVIPSFCMF